MFIQLARHFHPGILCLALAALSGLKASEAPDPVEAGFRVPPPTAHPLTWWHWINGNVTKEGIKADMEDMKRVGIAGAQMLDVSIYLPEGPVRFGSDAWYDHIEYAIETADKLGLEFTIMNGPGWSASGGPWVTPETSMKELVWSETTVEGAKHIAQKLPQPRARLGFYRDVAVVAVPADPKPEETATVASNVSGLNLAALTDGKPQTVVAVPGAPEAHPAFTFTYAQPQQRRLLKLTFGNHDQTGSLAGSIEASDDGTSFRKLRDFSFDGSPKLSASIEIPFAPTRALAFRVTLNASASQDFWPFKIAELEFSREYRTENFRSKIGDSSFRNVIPNTPPPTKDADAIPAGRTVDLTSRLGSDGALDWDAPAGRWTLLRFGYTSTAMTNHPAQPEGKGLEIDKMDADAVRSYFNTSLGRIITAAGAHAGKAFTGILLDSWEAGQQNWTPNFRKEFQARRGYDLTPYLPVLAGRVIGSPAETEAVLSDFRHSIADMVAENYFGTLRAEANKHRLKFYAEPYSGDCFNEMQCAAQIDVDMAEFWVQSTGDLGCVKKVASSSHTLGHTICGAESFTAPPKEGRWLQAPFNLKPVGDLAFTKGLNRAIFHTYVHQPRLDVAPGFTLGRYGTHFGRLNTWWPQAKPWIDYLSRCQFLLQQGVFAGDFLELLHDDIEVVASAAMPKLPAGYDFDYIARPELKQLTAEHGVLRLPNGAAYRAVTLPAIWAADLSVLQKLETIVKAGVPVFGPAPVVPTGLRDLRENGAAWQDIVHRLWPQPGQATQACARPAANIAQWLQTSGLRPDFAFTAREQKAKVGTIHRVTKNADIYFVVNQSEGPVHLSAEFRVAGKQPEIWDPVTGEMGPAAAFRAEGSQTAVDLTLDTGASTFVVFRSPLPARWITSIKGSDGQPTEARCVPGSQLIVSTREPLTVKFSNGTQQTAAARDLPEPLEIDPGWKVDFAAPNGKRFQRDFAKLHLWKDDAEPAVRYFSGQATYRTEFVLPATPLPASLRYRLDLGKVYDVAEVRINGQSAGTVWTPPYATDVTRLLKPGRNLLEVIVADRWVNRLIGDEQLPQDAAYKTTGSVFDTGALEALPAWLKDPAKLRERQRSAFATWHFYEADSPLIESGLAGPVKLSAQAVITLQ